MRTLYITFLTLLFTIIFMFISLGGGLPPPYEKINGRVYINVRPNR